MSGVPSFFKGPGAVVFALAVVFAEAEAVVFVEAEVFAVAVAEVFAVAAVFVEAVVFAVALVVFAGDVCAKLNPANASNRLTIRTNLFMIRCFWM